MSAKKNVVALEPPMSGMPWEVDPFIRVPLVLGVLGVSGNFRSVFQALCYRWWKTRDMPCRGITIASYRDIAHESGVSVRTAMKALRKFEELGWVKRVSSSTNATMWFAQVLPEDAIKKARKLSRSFDYATQLDEDQIHGLWEQAENGISDASDCVDVDDDGGEEAEEED